ncbi:MAG: NADH-quinone oxidoreductase subunit A [Pirellulales bacterium]|nr:NADH-quinone oxidoreductase subunit A [Pirellulales bacterium]
MHAGVLAILLFIACAAGLCGVLVVVANLLGPRRSNPAKRMPYESGMDPIHNAHRRFDFRFYLLAIAFLVFDVELLFLYPWAVTGQPALTGDRPHSRIGDCLDFRAAKMGLSPSSGPAGASPSQAGRVGQRHVLFAGVMIFIGLLALGFVYDWRKGVFRWR